MRDVILALDMGGTSIKRALVDAAGAPLQAAVCPFAAETREALLQTFCDVVAAGRDAAGQMGCRITHVGIACPGPFDFRGGISQMTHKWAAIQGVPLPPILGEILPGIPVSFMHDSTAFMLGEAYGGAARGARNPAGVMLGTGFGYTYMLDRRVCLDAALSPRIRLWREPWQAGIVEDYVSRRAIRKRYGEETGKADDVPDVREIADRADAGEPEALATFRETGALLGGILKQHLEKGCDLVVVGGQIAYAAALLLPAASQMLRVPIVPAAHIADAALRGIGCFCTRKDVTCTP